MRQITVPKFRLGFTCDPTFVQVVLRQGGRKAKIPTPILIDTKAERESGYNIHRLLMGHMTLLCKCIYGWIWGHAHFGGKYPPPEKKFGQFASSAPPNEIVPVRL